MDTGWEDEINRKEWVEREEGEKHRGREWAEIVKERRLDTDRAEEGEEDEDGQTHG